MKILHVKVETCSDCPYYDELLSYCNRGDKETDGEDMPEWCDLPESEDKMKQLVQEVEVMLCTGT